MEFVLVLGRILFSLIFIGSGINHLTRASMLGEYAKYKGVPAPKLMTVLSGIIILLGGLSVLLGYQARVGALLLIVFLLPTAFMMHRFWGISDPMAAANEQAHFMKTLALLGGALIILYYGSGPLSLGQ